METIHIIVTKKRTGNWFEIGDIYEVDAEPRYFNRDSEQRVRGYYLVETEDNNRMRKGAVHSRMCVGEDCCRILGKKNKEFKSLLQGE